MAEVRAAHLGRTLGKTAGHKGRRKCLCDEGARGRAEKPAGVSKKA